MKQVLILMAMFGTLAAQDKVKNDIERPAKSPAASQFDLAKTGIEWRKGLDAALNQGKPILLFQLLGNFDEVYC